MAKDRLYTEKEISTILKRAGERQAKQSNQETSGLSLEELQHIAGEVGLDPALVASVAAELDQAPDNKGALSWLKPLTNVEVERVLPGVVTTDQWPEIVSAIESELGVVGTSAQVGRMTEWTYNSKLVQYKASFAPGDEQTKVRFFGNMKKLSAIWLIVTSTYALGLGLALGATTFQGGGFFGFGLIIAMLTFMLVRFGLTSYINSKERKFYGLISRIENEMPEEATTQSTETTGNTQRAHIELPEENEAISKVTQQSVRKKVT